MRCASSLNSILPAAPSLAGAERRAEPRLGSKNRERNWRRQQILPKTPERNDSCDALIDLRVPSTKVTTQPCARSGAWSLTEGSPTPPAPYICSSPANREGPPTVPGRANAPSCSTRDQSEPEEGHQSLSNVSPAEQALKGDYAFGKGPAGCGASVLLGRVMGRRQSHRVVCR